MDTAAGGAAMVVRGARLRGDEIRLAVSGMVGGKGQNLLFRGRVTPAGIEGDVRVSDGDTARTLPWKAGRP